MPRVEVNGAEINYEELGSGPPMILTPGGLQRGLEVYRPVMEGLSQEHRVIAYDRRFGGQSRSPLVAQTWDLICHDIIGLMDALGIEQAALGGGAFGGCISLVCAARYPERVRAIFPSNINGGLVSTAHFVMALTKSMHMALSGGIKSVLDAYDGDEHRLQHQQGECFVHLFGPFVPEQASYDPEYRKSVEAMEPEDFAKVMRDTIYDLFDGQYVSIGMTKEMLKSIRTPTLVMPGRGNDIHPRWVAEEVHRLVPNSQWAEMPPHWSTPDKYVQRVLEFLAEVEANSH